MIDESDFIRAIFPREYLWEADDVFAKEHVLPYTHSSHTHNNAHFRDFRADPRDDECDLRWDKRAYLIAEITRVEHVR